MAAPNGLDKVKELSDNIDTLNQRLSRVINNLKRTRLDCKTTIELIGEVKVGISGKKHV